MKPAAFCRYWLALPACLLCLLLPGRAQNTSPIGQRLHALETATSFDQDGFEPWHISIDVDFYDADDLPAEHAAMGVWWQSPKLWRVDYRGRGQNLTAIRNADGWFESPAAIAAQSPLSYTLHEVLRGFLHPLRESDRSPGEALVSRPQSSFVKLECLGAKKDDGSDQTCVDSSGSLRAFHLSELLAIASGFTTYHGKQLPTQLVLTREHLHVMTASVKAFGPLAADAGFLTNIAGLERQTALDELLCPGATPWQTKNLHKVAPEYPPDARNVEGRVIVSTRIDETGAVKDVSPIQNPNDKLTEAAEKAIRKWRYTPPLLDGVKIGIRMPITVIFRLARAP